MKLFRRSKKPLPLEERIVGLWEVEETESLGMILPGDGSTISFEPCVDSIGKCSGFLAEDRSTNALTYQLSTKGSLLVIKGSEGSNGDLFSGEWNIESFTKNKLTMKTDDLLGEVTLKLGK